MTSLLQAVSDYENGSRGNEGRWNLLHNLAHEVVLAVRHYVSDSHISITYADKKVWRRDVTWNVDEQRFRDWGDNFWLYGPDSLVGKGKWVLHARNGTNPTLKALLDSAAFASNFGQVDRLWNIYWQILLIDALENNEGNTVDLHIKPLDVKNLESRPIPLRYLEPEWGNITESYDWKNYVSDEVKKIWHTFNPKQRVTLAKQAEDLSAKVLDMNIESNLSDR